MRVSPVLALILVMVAASLPVRAGDEHSYAEPDKVRIVDIALDLDVDFAGRTLSGRADLRLDWRDPEHRTLVLDTRALEIEKVLGKSGDGGWKRLSFSLAEPDPIFGSRLAIRMSQPYELVRVRYRTAPTASGLQWLEPSMTAGGKHGFLFSQSQAIHARSWVPLQDTPSVRFTYRARISTPPELIALMSADNDPDAARTGDYLFRMPQPIPSYLLAIAVGDLVFKPISARAGVWAEPATIDAAIAEFADTEAMIQATEALYGEYRWGRYDLLILPPSFPFGGMENPRLSFITPTVIVGDRSLVALIAHELAHSWSGNLVTNASWKDMWLNEGFTSYVENRVVEAVFGAEQAAMERVISENGLRKELTDLAPERQRLALLPLPGVDPDEALTAVPYDKGAWFLRFLEARFGRERFDPFLRGWFDARAFQSVTTADFETYLREHLLTADPSLVSAEELRAWLHEPGLPDSAPSTSSTRFDTVDEARSRWLAGRVAARDLATDDWVTQEWLHFLEGLPNTLEPTQLIELDNAFRFTSSRNGEISMRWYPLALRSGYFEAQPTIAAFLKRVGRRKLIMPVYEALVATPDGLAFAEQVFASARPGYHPITAASVQALIDTARASAEQDATATDESGG
ncbi:MAG TPA: aminopeptidase [Xanthomonadales bacterium]|nr:aminopeptidase [Xanthomonadales bacterium]